MNIRDELAVNLFRLMRLRGLTATTLSMLADMSPASIRAFLRAETMATPSGIRRLADALSVKPKDLAPSFCAEMCRTLCGVNDNG